MLPTQAIVIEEKGGKLNRGPALSASSGAAQRPPIGKGVLFGGLIKPSEEIAREVQASVQPDPSQRR
jgi:hypothetical protein